ncbi:hypothetical protein ACIBCR_15620 [Micromonospora echinospora]|uniref:hypothetical protein n=1 Tax=Micromonospora echinospora TaxID=1877 RepID=UPI0037BA2696
MSGEFNAEEAARIIAEHLDGVFHGNWIIGAHVDSDPTAVWIRANPETGDEDGVELRVEVTA